MSGEPDHLPSVLGEFAARVAECAGNDGAILLGAGGYLEDELVIEYAALGPGVGETGVTDGGVSFTFDRAVLEQVFLDACDGLGECHGLSFALENDLEAKEQHQLSMRFMGS